MAARPTLYNDPTKWFHSDVQRVNSGGLHYPERTHRRPREALARRPPQKNLPWGGGDRQRSAPQYLSSGNKMRLTPVFILYTNTLIEGDSYTGVARREAGTI